MSMLFIEEQEMMVYEINTKVSKEEKEAIIKAVTDKEKGKKFLKYLVDQYYQSQDYRIVLENQTRSLMQGFDEAANEEHPIFIEKELKNAMHQELLNKKYMDIATDAIPVCRWMKSITGIGPCISAYLYASFDVNVGSYNSNFLSYAGLNDNNNPWLGAEKAKALTAEAVQYRQEKFDAISEVLTEKAGTAAKFKKLISELKKVGKLEDIEYVDIEYPIMDICKYEPDPDEIDFAILTDYVKALANPKICDDILIDYVAAKTGRNPKNVKSGTFNNWDRKKSKSKAPTIEDLTAYLAKPPYNKDLKKMMFIVGDMFIKNSGRPRSLYGKIYKDKKLEYLRLNEEGHYADQAAQILEEKNFDNSTITYKKLSEGKLSDGHLNARARRYAVKLFISHVFEAMYYAEFREEPPQTYIIAHEGHHDYIGPEVDYRPFIDRA